MKTAEELLDRLQEIYDSEDAVDVAVSLAEGRLQRLEAIRSYGESIREEAAKGVRSFKVPLEGAESIVVAIMEPQNAFMEMIASHVEGISIK